MRNKNTKDERLKNLLFSEKDTTTIEKALSSAKKKWITKTKKQNKAKRKKDK